MCWCTSGVGLQVMPFIETVHRGSILRLQWVSYLWWLNEFNSMKYCFKFADMNYLKCACVLPTAYFNVHVLINIRRCIMKNLKLYSPLQSTGTSVDAINQCIYKCALLVFIFILGEIQYKVAWYNYTLIKNGLSPWCFPISLLLHAN